MKWIVHVATWNNVHGEDDVAGMSAGFFGAAAVADGVSSTGGAMASFLAANVFVETCVEKLSRLPLTLDLVYECLKTVNEEAGSATVEDARALEGKKKRYYFDCSKNGPCTRPLRLLDFRSIEGEAPGTGGKGNPATTLLGIAFKHNRFAIAILGDGAVLSTRLGAVKEELYVIWGIIPQYFGGVRVEKYVEIGRGLLGEPVIISGLAEPGRMILVATDGCNVSALARALAQAKLEEVVSSGENIAAWLLRQPGVKKDDDASIAVALYQP